MPATAGQEKNGLGIRDVSTIIHDSSLKKVFIPSKIKNEQKYKNPEKPLTGVSGFFDKSGD